MFYGVDRMTGKDVQIPVIGTGTFGVAAESAKQDARDLMISPRLISATLVTR